MDKLNATSGFDSGALGETTKPFAYPG